jgi:hypothetical protein
MAKIQYTSYDFNSPPDLKENKYVAIKKLLNENFKLNINPKSSFIETFKAELIALVAGIICGFIAYLEFAEWISLIFGILAFVISFSFIFSIIPSFLSYCGFLSDQSSYYSKLRKDIVKSSTYKDFINIREKRRWSQF